MDKKAKILDLWRVKDPFNCYSHLVGMIFSILGLVLLIIWSHNNTQKLVAFSVYGASLIVLYSASTAHHWLSLSARGEDLLRRFDHIAIFILTAGTYTPLCLITLRETWGRKLLIVIWGLAFVGTIHKLFFKHLPRWSLTLLYTGMGWIAVVVIIPLIRLLGPAGFLWLLIGGIFYTVGAFIYATKFPNPYPRLVGFHGIFHICVLAGSLLHFICMAGYVLPV